MGTMSIIEVISAISLILSCIFIIAIVFFQGESKGGMSQTITGQSSDNYHQRNIGRSKEMKIKKMTTFAAIFFFVVAISVNVFAVYAKGEPAADDSDTPPAETTSAYDDGHSEDDGHDHSNDETEAETDAENNGDETDSESDETDADNDDESEAEAETDAE